MTTTTRSDTIEKKKKRLNEFHRDAADYSVEPPTFEPYVVARRTLRFRWTFQPISHVFEVFPHANVCTIFSSPYRSRKMKSSKRLRLVGGMQIQIKTLTGRQAAFNFEPTTTVRQVKHALMEKEGIQVDQIRLIHSGKQLNDEKTLEEYAVDPGSVIHMVLQLRG